MSESLGRHLRQICSRSKTFRFVLAGAAIYAVLRLAIQGVYLAVMLMTLSPAHAIGGELPEWVEAAGPTVPVDLQLYVDAATRLLERQDLYPTADRIEVYQYSPSYALAFTPFLGLSPAALAIVHTFLHLVAYGALYLRWRGIFHRLNLERANHVLAWTLPVWLVFSAFWSDLSYLNIYVIMALLGTLLIDAVLHEHLGRSLLWLSIILQIKPHWAFAAVVPLLLGRYRFFLKLIALALVTYVAICGATILAVGPAYGRQQYVAYVQFLANLSRDFPWRGPDAGFLGYNHSITQIVVYLLGVTPAAMRLATSVKALLLIPLAAVAWRCLLNPVDRPGYTVPQIGLDLAFALYLGAFIWLDMVWELSLGVAAFPYLLSTLQQRSARALLWSVFLPYSLIDLWQIASFALFGMEVIAPGPYILTDPSIYVPIVMLVILTFYALLIRRLWSLPARLHLSPQIQQI
ncbi:MAG: hypothetical protein DRI48_05445 [Chloroflexi bacterium]|nr:MAG: hypothetical protein DRI48_05445 [Chloroflexota bacterium]